MSETGTSSQAAEPSTLLDALLEMGFLRGHIRRAVAETGVSNQATVHNLTVVSTWMLEHPSLAEDNEEEDEDDEDSQGVKVEIPYRG